MTKYAENVSRTHTQRGIAWLRSVRGGQSVLIKYPFEEICGRHVANPLKEVCGTAAGNRELPHTTFLTDLFDGLDESSTYACALHGAVYNQLLKLS